eukprot:512528_1
MAVKMMKRDTIDVSVKHEADFTRLFYNETGGKTIRMYAYVENDKFKMEFSRMNEQNKTKYVATHYEAALFLELCDYDGVKYIDEIVRNPQLIGYNG